jgi:hypothetical protein
MISDIIAAMAITLLDPTGERSAVERPRAPRLPAIEGQVIGLLDISKPRGDVFLDRLAQLITERGATVRRYAKPTFTKPAPADLRRQIAQDCTAVIEALAD